MRIIIRSWRCCLLGGFRYSKGTIFSFFNVYATRGPRKYKPGAGSLSSSSGELKRMAAPTHVYTGRDVAYLYCTGSAPSREKNEAKAPGASTVQMGPGDPSFGCWHERKYAPCDLDYNRNCICSQKLRQSRRITLFFFCSRTQMSSERWHQREIGMIKWSIRWKVTPMVRLKMFWWSNLARSLPGQEGSLENPLWTLAKAVARSHNYLPCASLSPSFIWGVYLVRQWGWSNFQLSETSACLCLSEPSTAPGYLKPALLLLWPGSNHAWGLTSWFSAQPASLGRKGLRQQTGHLSLNASHE